MTKFEIFVQNTALLDFVLDEITDLVPCFIDREYVEMDCSRVKVTCRVEDADAVYTRLVALILLS